MTEYTTHTRVTVSIPHEDAAKLVRAGVGQTDSRIWAGPTTTADLAAALGLVTRGTHREQVAVTKAETLAGLTEAIAGQHTLAVACLTGDDVDHLYCICEDGSGNGEFETVEAFSAHVAAVALAWLEGHGWAATKPAPTITNCRHDPACRDWWPNGRTHSQRCMEDNTAHVEKGDQK